MRILFHETPFIQRMLRMTGNFGSISQAAEESFHTEEYNSQTCVGGVIGSVLGQVNFSFFIPLFLKNYY